MEHILGEVIERCRRGDVDAFEVIYRQYRDIVFRICYRMADSEDEAADWSQEVFIRVFRTIRSFNGKAKFSTWLYRLVTNYCFDRIKTRKKEMPLETATWHPAGEGPAETLFKRERQHVIGQAFEHLDPDLRSVLVLKDMEGLCYTEISKILGIPEGTVGSRLTEARKRLAKKLRAVSHEI